MNSRRVLIIGGNGFFGRLLAEDLARNVECEVTIAGRRQADLRDPASLERALDGVRLAICAAGPYQNLPTTLLELCLTRNIHYIDLADDRDFVRRARAVALQRSSQEVTVCTAWSTVSALSGILTKIATAGMTRIDSIHIQMAPGNRGARQTATIASLLYSVGRPLNICRDGKWQVVRGWSEPRDFLFPMPVGNRRGYIVDVPDHELFPELFGARTVEFRAGSELQVLNRSLAILCTTGIHWERWSGMFQRAAAMMSFIGHDHGAIGVEVSGSHKRRASILAGSRAERMAVMPAAMMTERLLTSSTPRGLGSYKDWSTEDELRRECDRRGFQLVVEDL